jgi:ubiquinone biosynthesis protein COQ9
MAPSRALARFTPALRPVSRALHLRGGSAATARSCYHSYEHPPPPGTFNASERAILSAAYAHVPEHGFTNHSLSLGARDAGYLDISTNLLPNGPFSLIKYHLVTQREALAPRSEHVLGGSSSQAQASERSDISNKVELLTWERLLANRNVIHRWQEVRRLIYSASLDKTCDSLHDTRHPPA